MFGTGKCILVGKSFEADWLVLGETVCRLARALGASVRLVHVSERPVHHQEQRWAQLMVKWYQERNIAAGFAWATGDVVHGLEKAAEAADVIMLAVGSADLSSAAPGFLGSSAKQLLRKVHKPVLMVPTNARRPRADEPWRVLYPTDFSGPSTRGLSQAGQLVTALEGELHLLHVGRPTRRLSVWLDSDEAPIVSPPPREMDMMALESRLLDLPAPTARPVHRLFVESEYAPGTIAEQAQNIEADIVVMPSHGRGAVGTFFLGSVTETVVRMADRPILIIKP